MPFIDEKILTCPKCDTDFMHPFEFPNRVESRQDITDDDVEPEHVQCPRPACGYEFEAEWEGWSSHDDAG